MKSGINTCLWYVHRFTFFFKWPSTLDLQWTIQDFQWHKLNESTLYIFTSWLQGCLTHSRKLNVRSFILFSFLQSIKKTTESSPLRTRSGNLNASKIFLKTPKPEYVKGQISPQAPGAISRRHHWICCVENRLNKHLSSCKRLQDAFGLHSPQSIISIKMRSRCYWDRPTFMNHILWDYWSRSTTPMSNGCKHL